MRSFKSNVAVGNRSLIHKLQPIVAIDEVDIHLGAVAQAAAGYVHSNLNSAVFAQIHGLLGIIHIQTNIHHDSILNVNRFGRSLTRSLVYDDSFHLQRSHRRRIVIITDRITFFIFGRNSIHRLQGFFADTSHGHRHGLFLGTRAIALRLQDRIHGQLYRSGIAVHGHDDGLTSLVAVFIFLSCLGRRCFLQLSHNRGRQLHIGLTSGRLSAFTVVSAALAFHIDRNAHGVVISISRISQSVINGSLHRRSVINIGRHATGAIINSNIFAGNFHRSRRRSRSRLIAGIGIRISARARTGVGISAGTSTGITSTGILGTPPH